MIFGTGLYDEELVRDDASTSGEEDPPVTRNGAKRHRRITLDWSSEDADELSPLHPSAKRPRVIHVPSPTAMNKASHQHLKMISSRPLSTNYDWIEKDQLRALAKAKRGTAMSFRIMYAHRQQHHHSYIPPGTLIVQCRHVMSTGIFRVHTNPFLDWKMPGGTCSNSSVYSNFRPHFYQIGIDITRGPIVYMDETLPATVQGLIVHFVTNATIGTCPRRYFKASDVALLRNNLSCRRATNTAYTGNPDCRQNNDDFSDEEINERFVDARDSEEPCPPPNTTMLSDVEDDDNHGTAFDVDDPSCQNDSASDDSSVDLRVKKPQSSFKRSILPRQCSTKKPRKTYGVHKNQPPASARFHVAEGTNIVVVEGIAESSAMAHDHLRDIFMNGDTESIPTKGRLVELLPNMALCGTWDAQLLGSNGAPIRISGLLRDRVSAGVCISLRHEKYSNLGFLTALLSKNTREGDGVHVSVIERSVGCTDALRYVAHDGIVLGSISIAACEVSTSLLEEGPELASDLLAAVRNAAIIDGKSSKLENFLDIPSHAGISFLCKLTEKESYRLFVAQDDGGRTIALDVAFGKNYNRPSLSSASSTAAPAAPRLTSTNIKRAQVSTTLDQSTEEERSASSDESKFSNHGNGVGQRHKYVNGLVSDVRPEALEVTLSPFSTLKKQSKRNTFTPPVDPTRFDTGSTAEVVLQSRAGRKLSQVTPFATQEPVEEGESSLSPVHTFQSRLPFITPHVNRTHSNRKQKRNPSYETVSEISDVGVVLEDHAGFVEHYPSAIHTDSLGVILLPIKPRMMLTIGKSKWRSSGYTLFLLSLFILCIKVPIRDSKEKALGSRTVFSNHDNPKSGELLFGLGEEPVLRSGFTVVGSEWVSATTVVLLAATFGRA